MDTFIKFGNYYTMRDIVIGSSTFYDIYETGDSQPIGWLSIYNGALSAIKCYDETVVTWLLLVYPITNTFYRFSRATIQNEN